MLRTGSRLRSSTVKSCRGCTAYFDAILSTRLSKNSERRGSSSRPRPVRRRVSSPAGAVGISGSWDLLPFFFSRGPLTCAYPRADGPSLAQVRIPRESRLSPESLSACGDGPMFSFLRHKLMSTTETRITIFPAVKQLFCNQCFNIRLC